ncbi:ubiquitin-conjugating enzyme/RWD-like protein [Lentinula aciculospora]|uniref:Ubiquitin-conjugating enzyme/RWD-like protein n=1 Tax=Lentinula aciculospora TaxID=153920 RepID=A0A9W9DV59_9AGAR|nr:ubiquitin-conjugating enzyme/RWD-like protein [Lentinula aciculospora]
MTALRRLQKELRDINNNPLENLLVETKDDNLFQWECTIIAEPDSPYRGGKFKFSLSLPQNFPFKAPSVTFNTKIYHPGINEEGAICVPVLRDEWRPSVTLATVLSIIQEKLNNPSPDDPFEPDIAALLKNDKTKFLATAKEWTKNFILDEIAVFAIVVM